MKYGKDELTFDSREGGMNFPREHFPIHSNTDKNTSLIGINLKLVSKDLNLFEGIVLFVRDWASGTLTGGA